MKLKYKYFAIDFDNTIAYDKYPYIGKLIPGAAETIREIKKLGGEIIIWTCRSGIMQENKIKDFLKENNIPYDKFNESFDINVNIYGKDSRKVFSDVYIDDRCILWNGGPVDWFLVQKHIFEGE